jgi:putative nucleotidyltransferase with HDIG domain
MAVLGQKFKIPSSVLFVIVIALIAYFAPRDTRISYDGIEGKPWRSGLVTAPFDFPVFKPGDQLKHEQDSIMREYIPYYSQESKRGDQSILIFTNDAEAADIPHEYISYVQKKMKEIYLAGVISFSDYEKITGNKPSSGKLYLIDSEESNVANIRNAETFFTSRQAYEKLINDAPQALDKQILQSLDLNNYIFDNIILNKDLSEKAKSELLAKVPSAEGKVLAGQKIIDKGELVTAKTVNILNSLQKERDKENTESRRTWSFVGDTIMFTILIFSFMIYLIFFRPKEYADKRNVVFMLTMLLFFSLLTSLFVNLGLNIYIIPYAIATIMVRTFVDSRTATFTHLVIVVIASLMAPSPQEFLMLQIPVGFACIFSLKDLSERSQLMKSSFYILFAYAIAYVGITLAMKGDFKQIDPLMFIYFAINFVFVMFAYLLIYICEKIFGFISGVSMIELSNINKPLLQELAESAPGTFQHSMQVSNLAAAVAVRIGANSSLVRTGALYHDIGKLINPIYFTENQSPGMNPHKDLPYKESARIIISHVTEGIKIAKKHNLPQQIIDFIETHHGKGQVKYFYTSYVNEHPDEDVDIADFSYPGPNPFSKETGILMMADTVEAASRSLKEYTEESISNLVDRLINTQLNEGLLNNTPLTFKDVEIAKGIFKEKLKTIYHSRIVYPELTEEARKHLAAAGEGAKG